MNNIKILVISSLIVLLCSCSQEPAEAEKYQIVDLIFAPSEGTWGNCWFSSEEGDCCVIRGMWDKTNGEYNNFRLDLGEQFICWLEMESPTNLSLDRSNEWKNDSVLCYFPTSSFYVDSDTRMFYMPFGLVGDKVDHKFKLRFQKLSDNTLYTTRTLHLRTELNALVRDTLRVIPNGGSSGEDMYDIVEMYRDIFSISED